MIFERNKRRKISFYGTTDLSGFGPNWIENLNLENKSTEDRTNLNRFNLIRPILLSSGPFFFFIQIENYAILFTAKGPKRLGPKEPSALASYLL